MVSIFGTSEQHWSSVSNFNTQLDWRSPLLTAEAHRSKSFRTHEQTLILNVRVRVSHLTEKDYSKTQSLQIQVHCHKSYHYPKMNLRSRQSLRDTAFPTTKNDGVMSSSTHEMNPVAAETDVKNNTNTPQLVTGTGAIAHRASVHSGTTENSILKSASIASNTKSCNSKATVKNVADNEDEGSPPELNSDLSTVGSTSSPPTSELGMIDRPQHHYSVECTHNGWCDCPMHSSYPKYRASHLSEYALSNMKLPESSERSTVNLDRKVRIRKADEKLVAYLVTLQLGKGGKVQSESSRYERKSVKKDAEDLVRLINKSFPHHKFLPNVRSRVELVLDALEQSKADKNYSGLIKRVEKAVMFNSVIIAMFGKFLP